MLDGNLMVGAVYSVHEYSVYYESYRHPAQALLHINKESIIKYKANDSIRTIQRVVGKNYSLGR